MVEDIDLEKLAVQKEIEAQEKKEIEDKKEIEEEKKEPDSTSLIQQHREEREKGEDVLEKMKEEREKAEKLASELALAGKSTIDTTPEPTEHDKYIEKAKERYAGTGRDPTKGFERKF